MNEEQQPPGQPGDTPAPAPAPPPASGQVPAPAPESASGKSVTALVLGIVGIVLCTPVAIAAWIVGHQERTDISAGRSPQAGLGMATAGWILGIIGTALLLLLFIGLLVYFAFFAALLGSTGGLENL